MTSYLYVVKKDRSVAASCHHRWIIVAHMITHCPSNVKREPYRGDRQQRRECRSCFVTSPLPKMMFYGPRRFNGVVIAGLVVSTSSIRVRAFGVIGKTGKTATTTSLGSSSSSSSSRNHVAYYDVVIVGGGSAGLTAAKFAKTFGHSVVIIEGNKLGGDCTWTGCVPSKSLIAAAAVRKQSSFPQETVDFSVIRKDIQQKIQRIYDAEDSPSVMEKLGIDVIQGYATLQSSKELHVVESSSSSSDQSMVAVVANQGIILCIGARPRIPSSADIPGLDTIDYLTYEQVWELDALPQRLTVVGGGPIGCELAQSLARLGSKVTLIAEQLLPDSEPEANHNLEHVFTLEGIQIVKGKLLRVERGINNKGHVATTSRTTTIQGDQLLLAVGRTPNVHNMGLEQVGVELNERGGIKVNSQLQTTVKTIYAAGDCTGDRQFTHYAGFQGAIAARNILLPFSDAGVLSRTSIPSTTFTSPEIASVGWKEADAKEKFGADKVGVAMKRLDEVADRSICEGKELGGLIKVVYLKRTTQILGATIMAPVAGEMISEICVAMKAGMGFDRLATVIHPYPAYSIALQIMAAEIYYDKLRVWKPLFDILKRFGL